MMNTYPLIRIKWSNEHVMAALFVVLILYHIPLWVINPGEMISFIILTFLGLFLDAVMNMILHKKLWCCVSAAVTTAIFSLFTYDVPLWGRIIGLLAALTLGKYIWGGTGKNRINPAMVGLLIVQLFWNTPAHLFPETYFLLPAVIISLVFLSCRPYAGISFIVGALLALLANQDLSLSVVLSDGVFFWGCIVMTDPVTVTYRRVVGMISCFTAGFIAFIIHNDILLIIAVVFMVNLISYITDNYASASVHKALKLKIPKAVTWKDDSVLDLVKETESIREPVKETNRESETDISKLTADDIILRIRENDVYGMGGAGFPTYKKIEAVRASANKDKHLIVNGVECDPGLVHDHYIFRKYPDEILKGINLLKCCIDFTSISIAVKDERGLLFPPDIQVHKLEDRYPAGAEKIIIKRILNKTLDCYQLPADNGILVLNIQTIYSIYLAVYQKEPADSRFLTVVNLSDKTAKIVKVRLGMKLQEIAKTVYPQMNSCFVGGGMMQAHFCDEEATVDKQTNFIAVGALTKYKESVQCSRCGSCINNCPTGVDIRKISNLVTEGKIKETLKYNATDCISCGSCSYSCPAGRNLAAKVKAAKEYANEIKSVKQSQN